MNIHLQNLGESKISSMVESKDFRKSIVQLEWWVSEEFVNLQRYVH